MVDAISGREGKNTRDLLFELGTEELPPKSLWTLQEALKANVQASLDRADLAYGSIRAFATPRRLALYIEALAAAQPDKIIEKRGPALQAAYDREGRPTKAAEGFARSCGTTVDRLEILRDGKDERLCFRQSLKGAAAASLIPDIIRAALADLPIAKRMRWGCSTVEFVRPVHWAVLLFGDTVIEASILGVKTGRCSYGHRFHHPAAITLKAPGHYAQQLFAEGRVIVDFEERQNRIAASARQAAASVGGIPHIEADLLEEATALVEWPVPVIGSFDERYLALPPEVLMTTMQAHQKYFPVQDSQGALLPYFIAFSNIDSRNLNAVRQGNERVIRPRLADAEFFWTQDRKKTLESRIAQLSEIVFQHQLGTLLDKAHRVERLAQYIAECLKMDAASAQRAAILAKADLITEMVGEFPTLQGTMGRYYAKAEGEPEEVAAAIEEHYLPKQAGGELPQTQTGQVLSLADKIDTLAGIFSLGLVPSGDKDPYALRRAALGLIRISIEKQLDLDMLELIRFASSHYPHPFDTGKIQRTVYDFILDRLKGYCLERGYQPDEFEAVLAVRPPKPLDFEQRLQAVRAFRALPEADSLSAANKRIRNILRKSGQRVTGPVKAQLLVALEEKTLYQETCLAKEEVLPLLHQRNYTAALRRLARLRESVDSFFDHVMVMAEDEALRENRLSLLAMLEDLFMKIADISKLQPAN